MEGGSNALGCLDRQDAAAPDERGISINADLARPGSSDTKFTHGFLPPFQP